MVVGLFTDRHMIDHRVPAPHPERPERLQAILRQLEREGYHNTCPSLPIHEATVAELARVHTPEYLAEVLDLDGEGGGMLDPDTWLLPGSTVAARLAAGAAIDAVSYVLAKPDRRALCLVRPPGHHARPASGMGFCIYGNVAVAATDALARFELRRILIVDFDVHHGNGTQEVFYKSSRVGFLSIHRYPFYPGTGARDETGSGDGLGSV